MVHIGTVLIFIDYLYGYPLDLIMVLPSAGGAVGASGYWMQPVGDGCSGYLLPGWLTAY
jgi:hypothetical protein